MATMFVRHAVNDYEQWKSVYDQFAEMRREYGVTGASVHRDGEDPNTVVVIHHFDSLGDAYAMADSDELQAVMADAGVAGPPEVWFTEDVEETPY